ncbi:MAG: NAD(P)H-binding protein [Oscillospiraceae bacterium]|nr:NAD(P)H-binding protein [Oscillospiraceae bacterium]
MKRALILGGTGAMGLYLLEILSQSDMWEVTVTSRSKRQDFGNIHFVEGNAREAEFRRKILSSHYDVILDFMNYGHDEFQRCHQELLNATEHYIFLSSSRVYADSVTPITEHSPRLLEATTDQVFLQTQRYALRKARQEDMLRTSGCSNYTIIRPYITYSNRRLQLGIYEKEQWLYRLLNDKPIVIRQEILHRRTTLTYGWDVSMSLQRVMDCPPLTGPVHIVSEETMTWGSILTLYAEVIRAETGKDIRVYTAKSMSEIEELFEGGYNTKYDRLFDRAFDHTLAETRYGHIDYMTMKQGLRKCLTEFLSDWKKHGNSVFLPLMWDYEAQMDRMLSINRMMPEMDEFGKNVYQSILGSESCPTTVCTPVELTNF